MCMFSEHYTAFVNVLVISRGYLAAGRDLVTLFTGAESSVLFYSVYFTVLMYILLLVYTLSLSSESRPA